LWESSLSAVGLSFGFRLKQSLSSFFNSSEKLSLIGGPFSISLILKRSSIFCPIYISPHGFPPIHISIMRHPKLQISENMVGHSYHKISGAIQGIVPLIELEISPESQLSGAIFEHPKSESLTDPSTDKRMFAHLRSP
jgi:hypothetical protein